MYYKKCAGTVFLSNTQCSTVGKMGSPFYRLLHCAECLSLNGCFFTREKAPSCHTTKNATVHWSQSTTLLSWQMPEQEAITRNLILIYSIHLEYINTKRNSYLHNGAIPSMMPNGYRLKQNDKHIGSIPRERMNWASWTCLVSESTFVSKFPEEINPVTFPLSAGGR